MPRAVRLRIWSTGREAIKNGFLPQDGPAAAGAGLHHRRRRHSAGHLRRRAVGHLRHLPAGDGGARPPAQRAAPPSFPPAAGRRRCDPRLPVRRRADPCAVRPLGKARDLPVHRPDPRHAPEPVGRGGRAGARTRRVPFLRGQLSCPLRCFALRAVRRVLHDAPGLPRLSLLRPALGAEPDRTGHDVLLHPDGGRAVHADGRGLRKARHGGDPAVAARHGAHRADARARGELVLPDALPAFLPRRVRHRAGLDGRYHPAALRRRARRAFVPACRRARRARGLPQREATAEGGCIRT